MGTGVTESGVRVGRAARVCCRAATVGAGVSVGVADGVGIAALVSDGSDCRVAGAGALGVTGAQP